MLSLLSTVKSRLALDEFNVQYDALLTNTIRAVSSRFDKECNRVFARSEDATEEFPADETELGLSCYPIEAVTKFELKSNEADGWIEQPDTEYLIRRSCVVSLALPLGTWRQQARITYTGGYLLPGGADVPSATPLPADLEQAAVEQVAHWFQNRDKLGLIRIWPHQGTYEAFTQLDLLLDVKAILKKYQRWIL